MYILRAEGEGGVTHGLQIIYKKHVKRLKYILAEYWREKVVDEVLAGFSEY